jgi:mono/diheme cytochrome c family protein
MPRPTVPVLSGVAALGFALVLSPARPGTGQANAAALAPSFADDILPIFQESCVRCHGEVDESGFPYTEAGLSLMTYEDVMNGSEFGSVVEPGNPDDSYLLTQVENGDMPDEGDPLTPEQIALIREWIEAGAENN